MRSIDPEPDEQEQLDELLNDIAVEMGYQLSMAGSLHAYFASAQHRGIISQGTYDALRTHYGDDWHVAFNN